MLTPNSANYLLIITSVSWWHTLTELAENWLAKKKGYGKCFHYSKLIILSNKFSFVGSSKLTFTGLADSKSRSVVSVEMLQESEAVNDDDQMSLDLFALVIHDTQLDLHSNVFL